MQNRHKKVHVRYLISWWVLVNSWFLINASANIQLYIAKGKSLLLMYCANISKSASFHRECQPHSNTWFLESTRVCIPNGISIGSAVFTSLTTECPYTIQWTVTFPTRNCPFALGYREPHLIHGSLGPPKSVFQTATRSAKPFLQGSQMWPTDTDHAIPCVAIDRYC